MGSPTMPRQPLTDKRASASTGSRDQQDQDQRNKGTGDAEDYRTTTLRLRRDIIERAKVLALRQRRTMGRVIETAIDQYLAAHGLPR
jgi:hypothetical protein